MRKTSVAILVSLLAFLSASAHAIFDASDYRQNTYGPPTHYCDPTRLLNNNGAGTLANPWNLTQAMTLAVAGNVVGFLPGVSVRMPISGSVRIPAFDARASGTANNRIVFVTRFAAVALPNVETNPNRTELRHDGPRAVANGSGETGGGGPIYGSYWRDYLTFDGFYVDMAQAQPRSDSGVLRVENATGVHLRNFVIKGTTTNMHSNPVIYRPGGAVGTVLSNFRAYDFNNDMTGSDTPQPGHFSAQYGDQDFLIEHFEIRNVQRGIFLKGTGQGPNGPNTFNSGTIRYGIVSQVADCFMFHALDPARITTVEYNLCQDISGGQGINLLSLLVPTENLLVHHNTVARIDSANPMTEGGIGSSRTGIGPNVVIRDNLIDVNGGPHGHGVDFGAIASLPATLNFNAYYKNASNVTWSFNNVEYNTLASWRAATGREANSQVLTSGPFVNRSNADFHIVPGHPVKTMSSTNGEIGAYATSEIIGVDIGTLPPPTGSPCDLNTSGSTNVSDVQLCANQAIGVSACTTGDINQDSSCNVMDVQRVVNAALGGQCVNQ
jgi:hypothetical protein